MTNFSSEIWKKIPGYNSRYEVSSLGRVRGNGKIKNLSKSIHGYSMVNIIEESGRHRLRPVHRLVLLAFVGDSKLDVDHINGIKTDNRLENLEYVSQRENTLRHYKKVRALPTGVQYCKDKFREKQFKASIRINGKLKQLGYYKTAEEAGQVYLNAFKNIDSVTPKGRVDSLNKEGE